MVEFVVGFFGNNEKLLVVIRVLKLIYFLVMSVCFMFVLILGFGDIIVLGLLIVYCRRFDVQIGFFYIYYVLFIVVYVIGMIFIFVVLVLMKKG